jgi:hypothetical protein
MSMQTPERDITADSDGPTYWVDEHGHGHISLVAGPTLTISAGALTNMATRSTSIMASTADTDTADVEDTDTDASIDPEAGTDVIEEPDDADSDTAIVGGVNSYADSHPDGTPETAIPRGERGPRYTVSADGSVTVALVGAQPLVISPGLITYMASLSAKRRRAQASRTADADTADAGADTDTETGSGE